LSLNVGCRGESRTVGSRCGNLLSSEQSPEPQNVEPIHSPEAGKSG
jgi:hypothetical protein